MLRPRGLTHQRTEEHGPRVRLSLKGRLATPYGIIENALPEGAKGSGWRGGREG